MAESDQFPGDELVGIREVRHGFREYLDRVQRGERFLITDRGRPVGRLVPCARAQSVIEAMTADGRIAPPTGELQAAFRADEPITDTASRALESGRGERDL